MMWARTQNSGPRHVVPVIARVRLGPPWPPWRPWRSVVQYERRRWISHSALSGSSMAGLAEREPAENYHRDEVTRNVGQDELSNYLDDHLASNADEVQSIIYGSQVNHRAKLSNARKENDREMEEREFFKSRAALSEWLLANVRIREIGWLDGHAIDSVSTDHAEVWVRRSKMHKFREVPRTLYIPFYKSLVHARIYSFSRKTMTKMFARYMQMPEPRPLHIRVPHLEFLLSNYAASVKNDEIYLEHYTTILNDLKEAGLPISYKEHLVELSLVCHYTQRHKCASVVSRTFNKFREMEMQGVIAREASAFNVLMSAVIAANDFGAMAAIIEEMRLRKIAPDRFTYVNLMTYYSKLGNKRALQLLYEKFIESEQIADIVVLEAMIAGLVRCRDIAGAQSLTRFIEMRATEEGWISSALSKKHLRFSAGNLKRMARNRRHLRLQFGDEQIPDPEETVAIAPRDTTYNPLLSYYASIGDYQSLIETINRMDEFGLSRRRAYILFLKGFYIHSGYPGSEWTVERLENLLETLLRHKETNKLLVRQMSVWALRAYAVASLDFTKLATLRDRLIQKFVEEGGSADSVSGKIDRVMQDAEEYITLSLRAQFMKKPPLKRRVPYFHILA
ncbi:hypothetical protein V1525DRAFT_401715 [Lipomyces kononenkoae]|uniref:Uncharacterized protein n=1 Tax=Lipomyces kononenkoae TaxID=34357 RepID=A0ACC3T2P9_LIPKO